MQFGQMQVYAPGLEAEAAQVEPTLPPRVNPWLMFAVGAALAYFVLRRPRF